MDRRHTAPLDFYERRLEDLNSLDRDCEEQEDSKHWRFSHVLSITRAIVRHNHFRLVSALLLGQLLSLFLCGTGVTSQLLESKYSISVPTSQAFVNYVLLGSVFGVALAVRRDFLKVLWKNWWKYIILGIIDVEANYMVILAYKYINLAAIQLLDSFTIACVMVLSFVFLRIRYKLINLMGILLALIGILSLVLADVIGLRSGNETNRLLGYSLCLGGSILYAISNVAQEFLVKNHSIVEYLGLIGVSGSFVSAIQMIIVERESLYRIEWTASTALTFLGFGVSQFFFYSVMPPVMKLTSAVVVNLSLLTADIYTLFFGLYLFHFMFSLFYIVALFLIICGVFIYNIWPPRVATKKKKPKVLGKGPTMSSDETKASQISDSVEPPPEKHRGINLRGLLESSVETSGSFARPINKKKGSTLATSSSTTASSSEGSLLASQREKMKFESSSPYSPSFNYGSISSACDMLPSCSVPSKPSPNPEQQLVKRDQTADESKLKQSTLIPIKIDF